jgi:uncharacterized protein involved in outer membrane biogenesis
MRKAVLVLVVIVAVPIIAALVFWATFDINRYRGPIQADLQERLSRSVILGPLRLDLFPPSFRADKVIISDDPSFGNPRPFIQAEKLNVTVRFLPLLHHSVQITSLSLTRPQVELIKNGQGVWNFSTLGAARPTQNQSSSRSSFSLSDLEVNDGLVAVTDQKAGQPRSVYNHIGVSLKMRDHFKSGLVTISDGTIKLGTTSLGLRGTLDTGSSPAKLNLNVTARSVSLAEASRLAAAFGVGLSPNTDVKGRATANLQIGGTADHPALSGTISAGDVHLSGKDMPVAAQIKSVNFRLSPSDIRSDNFVIDYGGTPLSGSIAISRYTSATPVLDADLEAKAAPLPSILKIAKAYGVKALDNLQGEGKLSFNVHVSGPAHSLQGDRILRALDGNSAVDFNRLQVSGTNLGQEISKLAGFLKPAGGTQGLTSMSQVTGHFTIRNGVALTNDLKAAFDLGKIGITGTADLAAETLNLHVSVVVTQKVSQEVGGTSIGGYMTTVLANDQGELVVPVLVRGTFQDPEVSPDIQVFAKMKLKGLMPNSNNPAAGWAGIIGDILKAEGGHQQGQAQTQQQLQEPPENPLKQILQDLSGKKKQETQKSE